jgi:hypothetical protein
MFLKIDSPPQVYVIISQLIRPTFIERVFLDFTVSVWIQINEKLNNSTFTQMLLTSPLVNIWPNARFWIPYGT